VQQKTIVLGVAMLNVVMLSVVLPKYTKLNFVTLSPIDQSYTHFTAVNYGRKK
jgi:hypothetical protein